MLGFRDFGANNTDPIERLPKVEGYRRGQLENQGLRISQELELVSPCIVDMTGIFEFECIWKENLRSGRRHPRRRGTRLLFLGDVLV